MRWATNPDTLITGMIGIAVFHQNAHLIADMRRRAPGDAIPASCAPLAAAPDPAIEGMICNALRREWRYQQRLFPELLKQLDSDANPHWSAPIAPLLNDTEWLLATSAQNFAPTCSEAARVAAREDRAFASPPVEPRWVDRVAFANSVVLAEIAGPAYAPYAEHQLDYVAMRRLLAAFLQMEAMDAGLSNADRFAALPADLRDGPRPLVWVDDDASIAVPLRSARYREAGNALRLERPARSPAPSAPATTDVVGS